MSEPNDGPSPHPGAAEGSGMLAPFRLSSFRYQWSADLFVSWAFEMEIIILGWYVLVETGSVLMLTVFASLLFGGTLISPLFGVAGDRLGHVRILIAMRALYVGLAGSVLGLALAGRLTPTLVLVITAVMGLVRPSDLAMRSSIVAETIPSRLLMAAMGVSRTTMDSARVAGSLAGAGLLAALGIGPAYVAVTGFYLLGLVLTFGITQTRPGQTSSAAAVVVASPWRDLVEGLVYVWRTPQLLAVMWIACLVNLTAFPLSHGLLPYVAREIYRTDQTGLGYLSASFALGALVGSLALGALGHRWRLGRVMLVTVALWYSVLIAFGQIAVLWQGIVLLALAGFMQSIGMVALSVILLRTCEPHLRGRVMGVRMLAIYTLPIGLMAAGGLIARFGYPSTTLLYTGTGLAVTLLIAIGWRASLWASNGAGNRR